MSPATKKPATVKTQSVKKAIKFKTYSAKPSEVTRQWYLLDATEVTLGRLSTKAATLLTGKGKPMFTHNIDCGDYVVVINANRLVVSGNKLAAKKYYRHSEYPGNLKTVTLSEKIAKDSCEVIRLAIRGMLPKNKLMAHRLQRLKIYKSEEHGNMAQKPQEVSFK